MKTVVVTDRFSLATRL